MFKLIKSSHHKLPRVLTRGLESRNQMALAEFKK
jgi:hypothetical protein